MTRTIIIGGGIAGYGAALALHRVGIDARIYEARPGAEETGSFLTVASNGLDAFRAVGVDDAVRAAGFPTSRNVLLSHRGRRLGEVSNGGTLADGTVAHTIRRSVLLRTLHEHVVDRGIPITFNKRIVSTASTPAGVTAAFDDGSSATGDLLIGADGVHSTVRRLIDPDAPAARYCGLVNIGGYTDAAAPGSEPGIWHMTFGRRAFFGHVIDPSGGTVWFANVPRAELTQAERTSTPPETWRRGLIELFSDDSGPVGQLISLGRIELAGVNTYDLPTVPTWSRGRSIIIGDAAHAPAPSSGQGASLSMEDAVVLARSLSEHADVGSALHAYEAARRDRVERVVAHGARTSSTKTPGPVGRAIAGVLLPLLFRWVVTDRSLAWIYDHHVDLESARS